MSQLHTCTSCSHKPAEDHPETLPLAKWPTYSAILKNITEENGQKVYQCQNLKRFNEAEAYYTQSITHKLPTGYARECNGLIHNIINTLAVQDWDKIWEEDSSTNFIDRLVHKLYRDSSRNRNTNVIIHSNEFK